MSLLSEILNKCTGEHDAAVASLALEGLYALCEAEVCMLCTTVFFFFFYKIPHFQPPNYSIRYAQRIILVLQMKITPPKQLNLLIPFSLKPLSCIGNDFMNPPSEVIIIGADYHCKL